MKNLNFMWDLDGTLIDSYKVIVSSIKDILKFMLTLYPPIFHNIKHLR